jgi:CTP:molybdopterin cytidylyltransferase MocA
VLIFHAEAPNGAGPLVRALAEARRSLAERQRFAFLAAGADDVEIVAGPPDGLSFGERLVAAMRARTTGATAGGEIAGGEIAGGEIAGGAVVLGSGSIPLARAADLRRFVEVAAGPGGHALANNRYSADVVSVSRAADLAELPPLPADNALPRWLEERAGVAVTDLRSRWRLGVDIDTPIDLIVLGDPAARDFARVGGGTARLARGQGHGTEPLIGERLEALAEVLTSRRAELLVAGRISSATLRWLESGVACRVRALVEERGLRAASRLAQSGVTTDSRPPRSVLGELLDRDGPESLSRAVARMADGAVIDTRVLMAHRGGFNEVAWPSTEDRFASDLLLPASIADPWLRALTESAATSPADHPILLGGHTLVNGGLRLLAQRARAAVR